MPLINTFKLIFKLIMLALKIQSVAAAGRDSICCWRPTGNVENHRLFSDDFPEIQADAGQRWKRRKSLKTSPKGDMHGES